MTERMEPTNRMRWVRQKRKIRDDFDEWEQTVTVLQQLWREVAPIEVGLAGQFKEEWRDVPVEDGE